MTGGARWPLGLALLPLLLLREAPPPQAPESPPPKPAPAREKGTHWIADYAVPPAVTGGSPEPPPVLPPARTCQGAPPDKPIDGLPGQVNGKLVKGAQGLRKLRRAWGDALIVVRAGDFAGADLRGARLHNICFVGTSFAGSDWRGARARGIGFIYADLTGAKLQRARMPQIRIAYPQLERVDATGADFSDGTLSGNAMGSWEGLRLDRADLRRFRFLCGRTQENQCVTYQGGPPVSFRGADLRDARIDTYWGEADWTGARLSGSQISLRQLPGLARARIEGPLVIRETAARVRLSAAEAAWLARHVAPDDRSREFGSPPRPPAGRWIRPGRSALFAALPLEFDAAARAGPLYARLMPAIVSGAWSYVHVRVDRRGRVKVEGSALGANAHFCSISGPPLSLDRTTGWYGGPAEAPREENGKWTGEHRPVVRLWQDEAEIYRAGHPSEPNDYFACGARAFFYPMTRVPFPAAEARRLWRWKEAGDP